MASIRDDPYMKFLGSFITYNGKGVPGLIKEKMERGLENIHKLYQTPSYDSFMHSHLGLTRCAPGDSTPVRSLQTMSLVRLITVKSMFGFHHFD
jgi:hypothetical protein